MPSPNELTPDEDLRVIAEVEWGDAHASGMADPTSLDLLARQLLACREALRATVLDITLVHPYPSKSMLAKARACLPESRG